MNRFVEGQFTRPRRRSRAAHWLARLEWRAMRQTSRPIHARAAHVEALESAAVSRAGARPYLESGDGGQAGSWIDAHNSGIDLAVFYRLAQPHRWVGLP